MMKRRRGVRAMSLAMAVLLTGLSAVPAGAEPIDDGVRPTYDEAYYATLDYYGTLLEGSVVKSYALNGAESFTDYGAYDEVIDLTGGADAAVGAERTVFQFDRAPERFYFEGKTGKPFRELPWTVSLRYTLNGVPTKAEELAGQRGVVEILVDIVPDPRASEYARNNYTLEAMALFDQDDILSLEAPGAQVQLVGGLRTVLLMALPGEERHFTIRVGSDDFSFGGMTVLMVPATLAQLEEIAKLSQRKDDLEEDYRSLSGSLDALLDAMNDIQGGLYASAKGLDQLDAARGTVSAGKGTLYDDAAVLRGDLSGIAGLLEPVEQRTLALSQTMTASKAVLGEMTDTAVSLRTQLDDLEDALLSLEDDASAVRRVIRTAADMKSSLRSLQRALGDTNISGGSSDGSRNELKQQVEKVKAVGSAYEERDQAAFFEKMLALNGEESAAEKAAQMSGALALYDKTLSEHQAAALAQAEAAAGTALTEEQEQAIKEQVKAGVDQQFAAQEGWSDTKKLEQLHESVGSGELDFRQFCGQLPGVDAKTAKTMSDLWTVYNSGKIEKETSAGRSAAAGAAAGPVLSSAMGAGAGPLSAALAGSGLAGAVLTDAAGAGEDAPGSGSSGDTASGGDTAGSGTDSDAAPDDAAPGGAEGDSGSSDTGDGADSGSSGAGESSTVGGAAVDLIVDGLDSALSQANDKIDAIQSELNSTLKKITRPTGAVVGELAGLCGQLDDMIDLVDDAEDLSAALRQSSGKLSKILDDVDELRDILDGYEPTLQEGVAGLGALSTSAAKTLGELETLLADTEALMRTSGEQLDSGTRQALRGLAATLRQTAKAMAATGDVRTAKDALTGIIEDTWHEYTGDINNILLMDATAEPVSLTDTRNPAPSSVQVLLRTQEIKAEDPEPEKEVDAVKESTTFWGRIVQMFKDFWKAITGIFR